MAPKEVTFEESKEIQLKMLIEIDKFCRNNNLRYSLSSGTLIGAIRHKGFIPWDDDVDITMPIQDLKIFKNKFKSDNMVYLDANIDVVYQYPFPRVANTKTFSKDGRFRRGPGVCIDIYPVIECTPDKKSICEFIKKGKALFKIRKDKVKLRSKLIRYLPIKSFPGYKQAILDFKNHIYSFEKKGTSFYYQIGGPLDIFYKNVFDFDIFENLIDIEFEGNKFWASSKFHEMLSIRYGDFMKLPPEEDQHPYHCYKFYWK